MFTEAHAALNVSRSVDRVVSLAGVALSRRTPSAKYARYVAALSRALDVEPPPFCTDLYGEMHRAASAYGGWTAVNLIRNAQREGEDAKQLWSLAACSVDELEQEVLKRHAVDRSDHALAHLTLLDLAFPAAIEPTFRSELNAISPGYSMEQQPTALAGSAHARPPSLDDFIHLNLAQLRTASLHVMLRPALTAYCSPAELPRMTVILDSLLNGVLNQVADTAALIERRPTGAGPKQLQEQFCRCLRDFIRTTSEEPIDSAYHRRFGNYP